ncbi:hypothetical protein ACI65C_010159 [Semiaphis heraclei]
MFRLSEPPAVTYIKCCIKCSTSPMGHIMDMKFPFSPPGDMSPMEVDSDYGGERKYWHTNGYKPPLFKVPIENKLEWIAIVQKLTNQKKELKYVCFEHFSPNDVKTTFSLPNDLGYSDVMLKFPCINHRSEILTSILTYYVTMRMRQYTLIANKDKKNECSKEKKC